jgi:hypothetical protein
MLPIPDRPAPGLTTYDAKDPDTAYPSIEPLRPPDGARNILVILLDEVDFGASITLYYDGASVGTGRVEATQAIIFSADETTDIGHETGTCVTPDYTPTTSRFTGKIHWVQLDVGDDDHDHFIDPEERLRVAMARQ